MAGTGIENLVPSREPRREGSEGSEQGGVSEVRRMLRETVETASISRMLEAMAPSKQPAAVESPMKFSVNMDLGQIIATQQHTVDRVLEAQGAALSLAQGEADVARKDALQTMAAYLKGVADDATKKIDEFRATPQPGPLESVAMVREIASLLKELTPPSLPSPGHDNAMVQMKLEEMRQLAAQSERQFQIQMKQFDLDFQKWQVEIGMTRESSQRSYERQDRILGQVGDIGSSIAGRIAQAAQSIQSAPQPSSGPINAGMVYSGRCPATGQDLQIPVGTKSYHCPACNNIHHVASPVGESEDVAD